MELLSAIAAPFITGLVTLLGIILANRKQEAVRETRQELEKQHDQEWRDRITDDIKRLEGKVDTHNDYARLFQETAARLDERMKSLEQRR